MWPVGVRCGGRGNGGRRRVAGRPTPGTCGPRSAGGLAPTSGPTPWRPTRGGRPPGGAWTGGCRDGEGVPHPRPVQRHGRAARESRGRERQSLPARQHAWPGVWRHTWHAQRRHGGRPCRLRRPHGPGRTQRGGPHLGLRSYLGRPRYDRSQPGMFHRLGRWPPKDAGEHGPRRRDGSHRGQQRLPAGWRHANDRRGCLASHRTASPDGRPIRKQSDGRSSMSPLTSQWRIRTRAWAGRGASGCSPASPRDWLPSWRSTLRQSSRETPSLGRPSWRWHHGSHQPVAVD